MKNHFVAGLVILFPLAFTFAVITFVVNIMTKPFLGLVQDFVLQKGYITGEYVFFMTKKSFVLYGSQFIIILGIFLAIVILGALARWFFLRSLIQWSNYFFERIPFINKIYKTSRDVVHTLFVSQKDSFQKVVIVPFPHRTSYCIGFITRESPQSFCEVTGHKLLSVFLPTTPNPTSGYLLMFRPEEVQVLDMKVEDAIKFIISCGVIHPQHHVSPVSQ